jgi:HK97 gp10 family phage protein
MDINIKVQGLNQFRAKMKKYPIKIGRGLQEAIERITFIGEAGIKRAVVSGSTRAFDTGNLFRLVRSKIKLLEGEIRADAPYSIYVHEGTRYMRKRPFMTQGIQNVKNAMESELNSFIKKALR